jgi:hypothetical protein
MKMNEKKIDEDLFLNKICKNIHFAQYCAWHSTRNIIRFEIKDRSVWKFEIKLNWKIQNWKENSIELGIKNNYYISLNQSNSKDIKKKI